MAKTFKTTVLPSTPAEPAKPISERDFFDLTDEPIARPAGKPRENHTRNTNNTGNSKVANISVNTSNNRNTENNSNTNANTSTRNTGNNPAAMPVAEQGLSEERDVRQTFVVSSSQLEQLRDFVHARRSQGDYEYSQKQALQEALALLFASVPQAPPRPDQTRELEKARSERIRRGRTR